MFTKIVLEGNTLKIHTPGEQSIIFTNVSEAYIRCLLKRFYTKRTVYSYHNCGGIRVWMLFPNGTRNPLHKAV